MKKEFIVLLLLLTLNTNANNMCKVGIEYSNTHFRDVGFINIMPWSLKKDGHKYQSLWYAHDDVPPTKGYGVPTRLQSEVNKISKGTENEACKLLKKLKRRLEALKMVKKVMTICHENGYVLNFFPNDILVGDRLDTLSTKIGIKKTKGYIQEVKENMKHFKSHDEMQVEAKQKQQQKQFEEFEEYIKNKKL